MALSETEAKNEISEESIEPKEVYGSSPFDLDQLKLVWDDFAINKKEQGKDAEYAVLKQEYQLEGTKVILIFTNSVKLNILDRFRSDFITYLRKELDNGQIELETKLVAEEKKRIPYTNKEKFEHLAQKKPILNELKNRLGLDPDF